ncbi:putative F-box protein At1g50870 [Rutidosis leptorrhynchoides]|uniref:putative F-box protein At1g50870 n=1 Tax=Rutidosis leptorrhynchoides TaxID=125765 RepID=UPI003A99AC0C
MSRYSNSELIIPDDIPIEIQVEIIKHLPIKSLIQCTLLSKLFNAIIKSPSFIIKHSVCYKQQHHLFVQYDVNMNGEYRQKYVLIIDNDNDNFPQNKLLTVPETIHQILEHSYVLTSSHGLLCLADCDEQSYCIWNLVIHRCIVIPIPDGLLWAVSLGVCPDSIELKLVKIKRFVNSVTSNSVNWEAEVYSFSSGVWRTIPSDKPRKSAVLTPDQVLINGIIYFQGFDNMNGRHRSLIITFDLKSEKFGEVCLPDNLTYSSGLLTPCKRMESFALLNRYSEGNQCVYDFWIMKHDVPNSYEKLFSFKAPNGSSDKLLGFRKNGDPILLRSTPSEGDIIEVYNSSSKQFNEVFRSGGSMEAVTVTVDSFMETLFLIDQPNTILINVDEDDHDDDDDYDDDDDDDYDDEDDDDEYDDDDEDDDDNDDDGDHAYDDGNDDNDDTALPSIDMFQDN